MFNVKDKIIVITGGSGKLGNEFITALLNQGALIASIDISDSSSRQTSNRYMHIQGNVTKRSDMENALAAIIEKWNAVPFGLINNAALDSPPHASSAENGPFEFYPESSWDSVMTVNVKGTFIPCQVFGGAMAKNGQGSIINISSIYGLVSPDQRIYDYRSQQGDVFCKPVAYAASKSAIMNLTRYLATYWGSKGVRVNTLTFGGVFADQDKQFLHGYTSRVPLGRMAKCDEYNGAVIFLLSDASSYMTGSNLVMDGGWTAW